MDDAWIQTYTGRRFSLVRPSPEDVVIEDIAHALSLQCRFNGHTTHFYSVAQHSVLVAQSCLLDPLAGLLHDAAEAYIGDIVRPLKRLLPNLAEIEQTIMAAVAQRFGLSADFWRSQEIHAVDQSALATERRDLLPSEVDWGWKDSPRPFSFRITPRSAAAAERMFLNEFSALRAAN